MLLGLAPCVFVTSAQNFSVLSGAPTLALNVSEPELLMKVTGAVKPVSDASSVTVIGTPSRVLDVGAGELELVVQAEGRLGQGELDERAADAGVDGEQVVRAARLVARQLAVEAGEGRSAGADGELEAGIGGRGAKAIATRGERMAFIGGDPWSNNGRL